MDDEPIPPEILEGVESMRRALRTLAERAERFADRLKAKGVAMQEWGRYEMEGTT